MAKKRDKPQAPLTGAALSLPAGYDAFLKDLKERIRGTQLKAAVAVNRELIELYWHIGQQITERQERERWGAAVIDRLGKDLQAAFPGVSGFSRTNVYRMRAFYVAYRAARAIVPQPVGRTAPGPVPPPLAALPWGHNVLLIEKVKDPAERLWYARQAIEHGWSRAVLDHQKRAANGCIALWMPRRVVEKIRQQYSQGGKAIHRPELLAETDYTIIQRYQSVLRGVYNYYCMAVNVGSKKRLYLVRWVLESSLTKTLARNLKSSVADVYRRYRVSIGGHAALQVTLPREGQPPLVATYGGFALVWIREGLCAAVSDGTLELAWHRHASARSEVVQRLRAGRCELCGSRDRPIAVHHIRKLSDLDHPGHQPAARWERIMSARKRKTLVVCEECHRDIHTGQYDGPRLR
jgi:predicted nuclease of restriction endonuclease-like (RecB) superfamily